MANVIRTQFQGKDGRLNIDKGILTLYGGSKPVKWDITKRETTELLREFLDTAYTLGKLPSSGIVHKTPKNSFGWNVTTPFVERYDLQNEKHHILLPGTKHTKDILSAMVRANVK